MYALNCFRRRFNVNPLNIKQSLSYTRKKRAHEDTHQYTLANTSNRHFFEESIKFYLEDDGIKTARCRRQSLYLLGRYTTRTIFILMIKICICIWYTYETRFPLQTISLYYILFTIYLFFCK